MTPLSTCARVLALALLGLATANPCRNLVATAENVQTVSRWNCTAVLSPDYMAIIPTDQIEHPPCSTVSATATATVQCSCPAGYTDDHFLTSDQVEQGYGHVAPHNLARVTCARPCGEDYARILAKTGYPQAVCGCQAGMGCRFVSRSFPRAPDSQTVMVIPDDLREAARVVHCYHHGGSGPRASSAVDLLLCADLGVDYLHDHAAPRPLQCPRRQWLDRTRQTCVECARCPDGSGEVAPCSAVADTKCAPCRPHEYVSPHDRQCHSCDADQEWDPSRQRCLPQQRNIHQDKCAQQPGHVFLPWTQTCAPCPRHTRQVENRCEPCEANWQTRGVGATACERCLASHVRAAGDAECRECPAGEQAAAGAGACVPCKGQSVRALGVEACVACAPGYRAVDGARCEPCEGAGVDCVPCEDGWYLDATDRQCHQCQAAGAKLCPEGEQWVCSQCEVDLGYGVRKALAEQYTVPLRKGYEGVLRRLNMRHGAGCDGSKRLEETTALLYANDMFLRGDVLPEYHLCCEQGYGFQRDTTYNLYSCSENLP